MRERAETALIRYVAYLFHRYQQWLEQLKQLFFPEPVEIEAKAPTLKVPWKQGVPYLAVGLATYWWPRSRPIPSDVWVAVFSLEGLIATLLVAIVPFVLRVGVDRFRLFFWASIDAELGKRQFDEIERWSRYPWLSVNPASIWRAMAVALVSLVMLPLILVIPESSRVTVIALSLVWTVKSALSDALIFLLAEWVGLGPNAYWWGRQVHQSQIHCPYCQGAPVDPAWPPPLAELNAAYALQRQERSTS